VGLAIHKAEYAFPIAPVNNIIFYADSDDQLFNLMNHAKGLNDNNN